MLLLVTLLFALENCKKDAIVRNRLIEDLPVGYELEEPPYKPFKNQLDEPSYVEGAFSDDVDFAVSERVKTDLENSGLKKNDEEVTTIEGDVNLRLWKAQPRVFVHLEDENEAKNSKKKNK